MSIRKIIGTYRRGNRLTTYRDRYRIAKLLSHIPLSLTSILRLFGSDKQQETGHSYGQVYHDLFRPFRYKTIRLLEIGLLNGDSLLAWRCFFPFGTTIGIDIESKIHLAGDRTRIFQADQSSAIALETIGRLEGPFDIIIDDGSHLSEHQLFSFYHLFPHLKDGGLYVIEDVQTSFWSGIELGRVWDGCHISSPDFQKTCYGHFLELSKYLNHAEFATLMDTDPELLSMATGIVRIAFEHNVITIWKGRNDQPSNIMQRLAS